MSGIIQLLPDVVANQIAAGEVIQRPASALKELMENSIDAGSTSVKVIIREAGKALIQVIDNGFGMSEADARMCFERYATSKLRKAEDLFTIRTMGFRGEAMASIAAIAQVELKTRKQEDETGIQLVVEGAEFVQSQPVACNPGTSIAVRNLFYNVPARRNFLKSNAAEMRHIVDEFQRIALAHPGISFTMHHNDTEVFILKPANLRQRIAAVFGASYNEKLVPVEEDTTLISIRGYVGKPEFAKKTRGEQFFFVNNRFIKDPYLHHAVLNAFENLLPPASFPSYFLFLEIDPAHIDINIHPTKTEIKFEDDKSVYAILRASVKRALGKFSIAPTLDFEQETAFNLPLSKLADIPVPPKIQINPSFNPFRTDTEIRFPSQARPSGSGSINRGQDWSAVFKGLENVQLSAPEHQQASIDLDHSVENEKPVGWDYFQLACKYIVLEKEGSLLLIDQHAAHERVLYERNLEAIRLKPVNSQHLVFPLTIDMNVKDFSVLMEMKDTLKAIGFDISEFGHHTLIVHGIPPQMKQEEISESLESLAEQFINGSSLYLEDKVEKIARLHAQRMAVKSGKKLLPDEVSQLLADLFSGNQQNHSPSGARIIIEIPLSEIEKKFL